jgi:SAM-dependent methyltransferase
MKNWRGIQASSRERGLAKFDAAEAEKWANRLTPEMAAAHLADLARVFQFREGMSVLDAGAGTGTMCRILTRLPGLSLTALEPTPAMLAKLRSNPELQGVTTVEGFCDAAEDRRHFEEAQFDVIVSRQLANGLFDPLTAFRNWHHWLRPGGAVILIDGLFDRTAWAGKWEDEIDVLPLAAYQTTALTPYLLESVGFAIDAVERMASTNANSSTKVTRYVVVARKPAHVEPVPTENRLEAKRGLRSLVSAARNNEAEAPQSELTAAEPGGDGQGIMDAQE